MTQDYIYVVMNIIGFLCGLAWGWIIWSKPKGDEE